MDKEVLFSKKSDEWSTPVDFYNNLDNTYNFVFDLACSKENCKTRDGFTIEENSLNQDWYIITKDCIKDGLTGWLWLNPPYSKCKEFADKCWYEMTLGAKIVMLVPSRTDTKWFHNFIYKKPGVSIEFIKGRLKFGDSINSAPFPSMLVVFNGDEYAK